METENEFPYEIIEEENVWIPVTDNLKLAARIWRPEDSDRAPVPVVLEYIPYRKRFGTARRDEVMHKFIAGHGYACVRLDIRGSGESEGVLEDEYLQSELDDGVAAINWLAEQSWCDGNVGMMGISWGGFNSLQIAAMRPKPLKAIITACSTDDRYADDVHHMGGTLLSDNLSWASVMFSYNTMPPDPALVGERWRDMWKQRLEGSGLWIKKWLEHQRRDAYWRHGSVCENFADINIPVFAISGWADGYTNSVFRLMENLDVPRKGLVGPWSHAYPHDAKPGPEIDFLGEAVRWWDRWLKGEDNGVEEDPLIQAWMQESVPPNPSYETRPGRWVAEGSWPSGSIEEKLYTLGTCRALEPEGAQTQSKGLELISPVTTGFMAGKWCSYAEGPDLAGDQRTEDGGSLIFQTDPLEEDLEILGSPVAELKIASDKPLAMVAVRLSDMRPDHQLTRVTYGVLNLTHRISAQNPEPLEPGTPYKVRIPLNCIAQKFPKGHRIRFSVSSVYWPLAWASPEQARLTVWTGDSQLMLPYRPRRDQENIRIFGKPRGAQPSPRTLIKPEKHTWEIHHSLDEQKVTLTVTEDRGKSRLDDIDLTVGASAREDYSALLGDFTSLHGETKWERTLSRGEWNIKTITHTCLSSDEKYFYITAELDAYEGDSRIASKSWNEKIKRDYV